MITFQPCLGTQLVEIKAQRQTNEEDKEIELCKNRPAHDEGYESRVRKGRRPYEIDGWRTD